MKRNKFRLLATSCVIANAFAATAPAHAEDQPINILVTGAKEGTAPYEAPTQGSLNAGEPQSVISQHYIENNLTPNANFTDIINIAPSVSQITPNGPGNAEMLQMSIRGFQDGQFNVTFDGIPFNDSNDFTHHSTSYFTADTIGNVLVDRGPGTAAQIGNATFGGTVAVQSKDPSAARNVSPSLMFGSWRTKDASFEVDSGAIPQANGGRGMFTYTSLDTDGAMTNNGQSRRNAFFKYVQPVNADTSVTFAAMYNTVHQYVSQFGTTPANLAAFGPTYSLSQVPSSESYYGFNYDDLHTDFEYVDVKTKWNAVRLDNKTYTYAYYHKINETNDPSLTGGALGANDAANGVGLPSTGTALGPNDVGGQKGMNNYRSIGDILRAEGDIGPGTVRGGVWYDYQWNDRLLYNVDWTLGGVPDPYGSVTGSGSPTPYQRAFHDGLTTVDPFIEYEVRPIDALTITPGVRYSKFSRDVNGPFVPGINGPESYSHSWNGVQPSVYANYRLAPNASVYAQYARGFLAPKDTLAFNPSLATSHGLNAQKTDNYQAGATWKSNRLTVSGDLYYIKFNNYETINGGGSKVVLTGGGAATFKGVEFEGTYGLGAGFNLYGNWTRNQQKYQDGTLVQFAPDGTYAAGVIYDSHGLYGSLIAKHVGSELQGGNQQNYTIPGYLTTDLSLAYTLKNPTAGFKDVKFRFLASNLSNNRAIYYVYGNALNGDDAFMTLPGRSYFAGISADF